MSFAAELRQFVGKVDARGAALLENCASHVHESITVGSAVTGAPGQPVDTGNLRSSWQIIRESDTVRLIATNVAYAESNEDGIARPGGGPYTQKSPVGGRHSVKLTRAGWSQIVAVETAKLAGRAP